MPTTHACPAGPAAGATPVPGVTLFPDQVARRAAAAPGTPAVVESSGTTTYGDLDRRADLLARFLRPLLPAPETPVAACLPRSAHALIAALGVMRAGGCPVLLNPADPPARLAAQLDDCRPPVLLSAAGVAGRLPADGIPMVLLDRDEAAIESAPEGPAAWPLHPDSLSQIIYTSGSTGTPKAVGGCHGALANLTAWSAGAYGVRPGDRSTWVGPPSFGAVLAEVWSFLAAGASIHIAPDDVLASPRTLRDFLIDQRITVVYPVRSLADRLCELDWPADPALRLMISTGERFERWMPPELPFDYVMTYGCSEMLNVTASVDLARGLRITSAELSPEERAQRPPCCGWPMVNRTVHVLDERMRPVAPGGIGELYLGGEYLFRGYLGRPGETADRLVPQPSGTPGERLYRSGDRGRIGADGTVEVLGRADEQVQIRGHRVEPAEVERALSAHASVAGAVVRAVPNATGDLRLVAWVVAAGGAPAATAVQLRAWVGERLPSSMVPSTVVFLPEFPLNRNGKVDRNALTVRDPDVGGDDPGRSRPPGAPVAPRTAVEASVAGLCGFLLGATRIGIEDRLPDLGADSLTMMRLATLLEQMYGTEFRVGDLAAAPTVAAIAARITGSRNGRTTGAVGAGTRPGGAGNDLPVLVPDPAHRLEPFGLTATQQAYWIGRSDAVELGGVGCQGYFEWDRTDIEPGRLEVAWRRLIDRHEMLRAVVLPDGTQRVLDDVPPYVLENTDLRGLPADEVRARLREIRESMEHEVFDPEVWPMYRIRTAQLDGGRTRIHLSFDLVIADAWSYFAILVPELHQLYTQPDVELEPLDITFRDYLAAAEAIAGTDRYRRSERYWRERLPSLPPAPQLPATPASHTGSGAAAPRFERWSGGLDAASWHRLRRRAAERGMTPAGTMLTAFAEVMRAWTGQDRFTINLPLFDRLPLHPHVDRLVGDFTSTLLLGVEDWPGTFTDRGQALQRVLNEGLDHRFFSGTSVLRELNRGRGTGGAASMPVVVTTLLGTPRAPAEALGEPVYGVSQTPQVLLDVQIYENGDALTFTWDARAALLADGAVDAMFTAYRDLLERLAGPAEATWIEPPPRLVPDSQLRRRERANDTAADVPDRLLTDYVAEHAAARPDAVAVVDSRRSLSYAELDRHAAALTADLVAAGVRPGALVAVVLTKGWEQVVAVLAAAGAGAAYLPVDPALPAERIRLLLASGSIEVALTTPDVDARVAWPDGVRRLPVTPLDPSAPAPAGDRVRHGLDRLAYVLYTSGSTGQPKGAMVEHRGVMNTVLDVNRRIGIGPADRAIGVSSLSFDLSAYDIFGLLAAGGTLVLPDPGTEREPAHWARLCRRRGVTVWNSVPALAQMLVEHLAGADGEPLGLRRVLLSGDLVPPALPKRIWQLMPDTEVISLGGPTETSIWSITHPVRPEDTEKARIPYGLPLANCRHHVLDGRLRPSPDLVPGEIYIGGAGVGRGYWADPERTAERFVTHPDTGERLFRSGDVGFFRADGEIEILGRTDRQVKINGHRVEPGEIEAVLIEQPTVRAAAVVPVGAPGGGRRLAGFVEPAPAGAPIDPEHLRAVLGERLPDYLVPPVLHVVDRLPLSANGKVDRGALGERAARPQTGATDRSVAAPGDPGAANGDNVGDNVGDNGRAMLDLWRRVLDRTDIGLDDNFFELGGDSVTAVRLVTAIRRELGAQPSVGTVFRAPTARRLARLLGPARTDAPGVPTLASVAAARRPGPRPLSFAQRRLWFVEQLRTGQPAYNLCSVTRLAGPLDAEALRAAIDRVVARHEVLRTTFTVRDGEPVQVVGAPGPIDLPVVDLGSTPAADRADAAQRLARMEATTPFDLEHGPLFRFVLARLGPAEHVLVQTLHHLVFDGRSLDLLGAEVAEFYRARLTGRPPRVPELPVQYGDLAVWQRERERAGLLEEDRAYWLDRLAGSPPLIDLATRPRPAEQSHSGVIRTTPVDANLTARLGEVARSADTTLYTVLLTAFGILLRRYGRSDDLPIGTPMSDRDEEELADLLGFCVNTVVLRLDLAGDPTIAELLSRSARVVSEAHEHGAFPFELLIEALRPDRTPSHNPLFQVMFAYEDGELASMDLVGLRVEPPVVVNDSAKFDLTLTATRAGDALALRWEYATDVLDADTVGRMCGELLTILDGLVGDPTRRLSQLAAAPPPAGAEPAPLTVAPAPLTAAPAPLTTAPALAETLVDRFAAQVARTPDATAVTDGMTSLTYQELDERAARLADAMTGRGIGPEDIVGVCLDRSVDVIAALIGVVQAGAAYLPLDTEHPAQRLATILHDARPSLVLASGTTAVRLREVDPDLPITDPATLPVPDAAAAPDAGAADGRGATHPDALAYVIYTSGSTGTPKGVAVSHRNVVRLFDAAAPFGLGPSDVWTLAHSTAFDFSVWEMWGALLHGGRLVVVPQAVVRSPDRLRDLVDRERVTVLSQTPGALARYVAADLARGRGTGTGALRLVVIGGDALELAPLAGWFDRYGSHGPALINMYGITETTVHVTMRPIDESDLAGDLRHPIGRPLPTMTGYVLDDAATPVPVGAVGELYVGGSGVSRGYLGRAALTADRFRPDPWSATPGARMYRSGDLVRRFDGDLDYVGRADRQLKIRGFRIEPAELEAAMTAHPRVREAVAVGRPDEAGRTELVGYVVTSDGEPLPEDELRGFLARRLPGYLVPAVTTRLDRLPLNANGKVDRDALPDPVRLRGDLRAGFEAPVTELERTLTGAWASVLGLDRVGVTDDFFALGGDSMRTVEIVSRLVSDGVRLAVGDVYRHPTPRALARHLDARPDETDAAGVAGAFGLLSAADRATLLGRFGSVEAVG